MDSKYLTLKIHQVGHLANILNRMKDRLKAYQNIIPQDIRNDFTLDIEEIKEVFNHQFREEAGK